MMMDEGKKNFHSVNVSAYKLPLLTSQRQQILLSGISVDQFSYQII
jgi:hypothetical protein